MNDMEFKLNSDFIKLDQLLKATNVVSTGGEAKVLILNGNIKVNGEIEKRRGRKIYKSYEVESFDKSIKILVR